MDKINAFLADFVNQDYKCNLNRFNTTLTEAEYKVLEGNAREFFWKGLPNPYNGWGIDQENLGDPEGLKRDEKKVNQTLQRTLFQIRHYRSPQLGDVLREKIKTDELWGCLCSYHIDNGMELDIAYMYFIAETEQGLKIIYKWGFEPEKQSWCQTHDHLPTRVEHAGTLVEVLNLQPPVELASLGEYFNPTHSAYTMVN